MDSQFILAVDLGTTNCKVLILDEGLNVIEKVTTEYPITFPRPGWVEQLPEDWWKGWICTMNILGPCLRRFQRKKSYFQDC